MDPNLSKKPTINKKVFLGLFIILTTFILIYVIKLFSSPPPSSPTTVTPPPLPTPDPQLIISQQKINFTWKTSLPTNIPTHLPFYTITQPLLNTTTIPFISTYFNFTSQNQIDTQTSDYLWVDNNLSLFISPSQQLLTYNNANPEPNLPSPTQQSLTSEANQIINQLLPTNTNFKLNPFTSIKILTYSSTLNYSQTINDYFVITPTTSQSILTLSLNNQLQIQYLEILGGYQQTISSEPISLINTQSQLENIAPISPIRLHTTEDVSQESSIDQSQTINFTVNDITLIYYQSASSNILHPSFLLQGNLKTTSANIESAAFIVPAYLN